MAWAKVSGLVAAVTLLLQIYLADADCGYENCPVAKPGYLNVHLVAHTHDDVGWLKTVDQYYYGGKNSIQLAGVQYILDSVISELQKAPDRRFIYVESGFFWRWWKNQDEDMKNVVRTLVDNGQLEFIGGGWCMNDEAAASYNEIIDQMTLGLRFLNDTFGKCGLPKVAWQIDPFGHSREQASIFAQMGFDGLFFGRLDYQDKENRELHKNMETIWSASPENYDPVGYLPAHSETATTHQMDFVSTFSADCRDEPIQDDPDLLDYNLKKRVDEFISAAKKWAMPYKTKNILMTMGSDFHYLAAHLWFKNMDKLIKHVNQRQENGTKINLFYSTPSCYLQELNRENTTWSVKTDDFFPYASDPYSFWTGYFTSRPALKYFVHKSNNLYQACQQLAAVSDVSGELLGDVFKMAEPMGVLQHHDAVSGTAKQHVTDDYSRRLQIGVDACQRVISKAITRAYNNQNADKNRSTTEETVQLDLDSVPTLQEDAISFCPLVNISACRATETESNLVISAYNPLARVLQNYYIRIPVASTSWKVEGPQGEIPTQVLPIPPAVNGVPGRKSSGKYELTFNTGSLPALTVTHFQLTTTDQDSNKKIKPFRKSWKESTYTVPVIRHRTAGRGGRRDPGHEPTVVEEGYNASNFVLENSLGLKCEFDGQTGQIVSISMGNDKVALSQNFYYYEGHIGNNTRFEYRASGAYIFRPNGTHAHVINQKPEYRVFKGNDVSEVRQTFGDWVSQVIRIYDKQPYVEFEWLIGSIPIEDGKGKEVITRYTSDLKTRGFFYTDSNGREILERKRDFRQTWPYQVYEPIAGNYYPVNSRIYMEDRDAGQQPKRRLLVLNDRSQGGSSINDGELELMLHRRLLLDDAFGVDEALNEEQFGRGLVTRGIHRILFTGGYTALNPAIHRSLGQEMSIAPILSYYRPPDNFEVSALPTPLSKLSNILPDNCHLLTLTKLETNKFILRLEHLYEKNEDPQGFSKPIQLSISRLQEAIGFDWIRETTLGANQWKDEARRMDWRPENARENVAARHSNPVNWSAEEGPILDDTITLQPMEIRTFLFSVPQLSSELINTGTGTSVETNHIRQARKPITTGSDEM